MSTQMTVTQEPEGWAVLNAGKALAINGVVHYPERDALVKEVEARGIFVWTDGTISKEKETGVSYTPDPAPPTQDPPVDPGHRPGPDTNPTVPVNDTEPEDEIRPFRDDSIVVSVEDEQAAYDEFLETRGASVEMEFPITDESAPALGLMIGAEDVETVEDLKVEIEKLPKSKGDIPHAGVGNDVEVPIVKSKTPPKPKKVVKSADAEKVVKAPRKPRSNKKPEGAPRFTEEQKKARAAYAAQYRAQMTDEQKERARERAKERQKKWREAHPDKAAQYAKVSSERRRERYNEDPEFRDEYREKQKQYASKGKDGE